MIEYKWEVKQPHFQCLSDFKISSEGNNGFSSSDVVVDGTWRSRARMQHAWVLWCIFITNIIIGHNQYVCNCRFPKMLLLHALEQRTCTLPDHGCRRQVIKCFSFWVVWDFYLKFLDYCIWSHAHSKRLALFLRHSGGVQYSGGEDSWSWNWCWSGGDRPCAVHRWRYRSCVRAEECSGRRDGGVLLRSEGAWARGQDVQMIDVLLHALDIHGIWLWLALVVYYYYYYYYSWRKS